MGVILAQLGEGRKVVVLVRLGRERVEWRSMVTNVTTVTLVNS